MAQPDVQLIGQSPAFLDLMDRVSKVAPLDRPVLVIGERGTGKELIAARLHYLSRRWDAPYLTMNCAALPEGLLESELFGHEAGAFTGASRARAGRFEAADRGTMFLDEIATMSQPAQEKLLRVIEYGSFQRVGSNDAVSVDVRIVGATNVDLPSLAEAGKFRADLLDRLSFDVLTVPPLRHRREDIEPLARHFGRAMAVELGWEGFSGYSDRVLDAMLRYDWPGNVRELKNVAERAVYQWEDRDRPVDALVFDPFVSPFRPQADLKPQAAPGSAAPATADLPAAAAQPLDLRARVAAYEKQLIEAALEVCRYNQKLTAGHLGLSYDQLRHALKKHGVAA